VPDSHPTVLLVDDDAELCALMSDFFAQHDFRMQAVHDGRRGLAQAVEGGFDLVLLDVMMPGLDGFELLRQLRRRSNVPVIMLTARTEHSDRIMGLNAGTRSVWRGRTPVDVTSIEYDILDVLIRSAGRAVSRDELSAVLYQREALPFDRALDVHVSHLRKKLEQKDRELIKTVRGVGYLFCQERERPEP